MTEVNDARIKQIHGLEFHVIIELSDEKRDELTMSPSLSL
jgi:hypothetical protein